MWHKYQASYCFRTWYRWHGKHRKQETDEPNRYHWLHKKNGQKCPCGETRHYYKDWVGIWEVVDVYTTYLKAITVNSCIPLWFHRHQHDMIKDTLTILIFIVRHLNSIFVLREQNLLRHGPLNRCVCLTIHVCKLWTECDVIIQ